MPQESSFADRNRPLPRRKQRWSERCPASPRWTGAIEAHHAALYGPCRARAVSIPGGSRPRGPEMLANTARPLLVALDPCLQLNILAGRLQVLLPVLLDPRLRQPQARQVALPRPSQASTRAGVLSGARQSVVSGRGCSYCGNRHCCDHRSESCLLVLLLLRLLLFLVLLLNVAITSPRCDPGRSPVPAIAPRLTRSSVRSVTAPT